MNWKILPAGILSASLMFGAGASQRLEAAANVFKEVMEIPDRTIPQELLSKAACVIVVPGVLKAAFVVGAKYGKGFVSCRNTNGVGWSSPGSVRIEGGSFGLQIGGSETDVIMLVMNQGGVKRLLSTQFTIGGDVSAAAGPVGRSTQAETDAAMTAELLTWSRARGLFAGISLSGATLRQDDDWNQEIYGKKIANREILTSGGEAPKMTSEFLAVLNRYSSRK